MVLPALLKDKINFVYSDDEKDKKMSKEIFDSEELDENSAYLILKDKEKVSMLEAKLKAENEIEEIALGICKVWITAS